MGKILPPGSLPTLLKPLIFMCLILTNHTITIQNEKNNLRPQCQCQAHVPCRQGDTWGGAGSRSLFWYQLHAHTQSVADCWRRAVFMMGSTIVIKELKDSFQETFIAKDGRFQYVTALYCYTVLGAEGRHPPIVIFLGESSSSEEEFANISIFETEKCKLRQINTNCRGIIRQLAVHPERSEVSALINSGQNLQVALFNFERNRFVAKCEVKFGLEKISMHPIKEKSKQLYFMGGNSFRIWNVYYQEQLIKESHQSMISLTVQKQHKFNDHCWTTINKIHTLLIISKHLHTNKNRLLILQNDSLVHSVNIDINQTKMLSFKKEEKEERYSIGMTDLKEKDRIDDLSILKSIEFNAISPTKKGFVVGGSKRILVLYDFEKNFGLMNTLTFFPKNLDIVEQQKIMRIHLSSNQEIINFSTINQIGSMNFYIVNTYQLDSEASNIEQFFKAGFHTKQVHSLSRAVTKSLLASCSQDNTVKLWNYFQNETTTKSGILTTSFADEPLGVSIHPSGHFVAVSFSYGFKIYAVVGEELVMLKESQLPNCRLIQYSNGGHYLIVNQKQHIFVYDTVYYQTLHLFSLGSPVQEIAISQDDLYMVATCNQGFTYCQSFLDALKTSTQKVMLFAHQESTIYNSIGYDSSVTIDHESDLKSDLFVGSTNEKYMVLYKNKCKELVAQFPIIDCIITKFLISKSLNVLFAGTNTGRIRVYLWPLDQSNLIWENVSKTQVKIKPPPYYEVTAHSSAITSLCISQDDKYLFSSAEDGTIICLRILEKSVEDEKKEKMGLKEEDKKRIAQSANDLYLQKVKVIQGKNETIQKYRTDVIRSQQRLKLQQEKLKLMSQQNIQNLKKEFNLTLQSQRKMKQTYIQNNEKEYKTLLEQLTHEKEKYEKDIEAFKNNNQKKIEYQKKRNLQLEVQIQELKEKHKKELQQAEEAHKRDMKKNKVEFFNRCQKLQIKYTNIMEMSRQNAKEFIQKLDHKEREYETQIQKQIREKTQQIEKVRDVNKELNEKNDNLQKTYNDLKKKDQQLQLQFQKQFKEHNNIRFENLKNDQDILKMQHQLLERLQVIDSKEETCKAARYEQATLENFRYILDSKIESLQERKKQMMQKIEEKESDLKRMLSELVKQSEDNQTKYRELTQMHAKIQVLEKQLKASQGEISSNNKRLAYIQNELAKIIKSDDDIKTVAIRLQKLLEQHCPEEQITGDAKDAGRSSPEEVAEVNEQLQRQNKWMSKKLGLIRGISQKEKQIRKSNIISIINKNVKLIQECTNLRNDNDELKKKISDLEKKLAEFLRKKNRLDNRKQVRELDMSKLNKRMKQQHSKVTQQRQNLAAIEQVMSLMVAKPQGHESHILKDLQEEKQ